VNVVRLRGFKRSRRDDAPRQALTWTVFRTDKSEEQKRLSKHVPALWLLLFEWRTPLRRDYSPDFGSNTEYSYKNKPLTSDFATLQDPQLKPLKMPKTPSQFRYILYVISYYLLDISHLLVVFPGRRGSRAASTWCAFPRPLILYPIIVHVLRKVDPLIFSSAASLIGCFLPRSA
jgi:hypothetical protein